MVKRELGLLLVTLGQACTVVVPEEYEVIYCTEEGRYGPPACIEGSQCIDGQCDEVEVPPSTCCASAECGAGDVCMRYGEDTLLCVDAVSVGHAPPGEQPTGAACFEGGDCRSGSCQLRVCVDVCCGTGCSP